MRARPRHVVAKKKGASRLTNGHAMPKNVDQRSPWARRFRDLLVLFSSDINDPAALSQGQLALVRRTATLCVELEIMETRFARAGGAKPQELETFQRVTNTLRRLVECLGIHQGRIAKDVTMDLQQYLARKVHEETDAQEEVQ